MFLFLHFMLLLQKLLMFFQKTFPSNCRIFNFLRCNRNTGAFLFWGSRTTTATQFLLASIDVNFSPRKFKENMWLVSPYTHYVIFCSFLTKDVLDMSWHRLTHFRMLALAVLQHVLKVQFLIHLLHLNCLGYLYG